MSDKNVTRLAWGLGVPLVYGYLGGTENDLVIVLTWMTLAWFVTWGIERNRAYRQTKAQQEIAK